MSAIVNRCRFPIDRYLIFAIGNHRQVLVVSGQAVQRAEFGQCGRIVLGQIGGFGDRLAYYRESGRLVSGCNVENAGYGVTLCAECGLVSELVRTGERAVSLTLLMCVSLSAGSARNSVSSYMRVVRVP